MIDYGGFEGNAQALHMLTSGKELFSLEQFDLTKRTLLGILKYPVSYETLIKKIIPAKEESHRKINHEDWSPPKCHYDSENDIIRKLIPKESDGMFTFYCVPTDFENGKSKYKTFDCSIMEIADDISNSIHDLEDVIYLNRIKRDDFSESIRKLEKYHKKYDWILSGRKNSKFSDLIENLFKKGENKKAISDLIYLCVRGTKITETKIKSDDLIFFYNVELEEPIKKLVDFLKDYIMKVVILSDQVQTIVHGGMVVISRLFDAYESNPKELLSKMWYEVYESKDRALKKRVICNFIAGMTDEYAYRVYSRLFGHNTRNMFEKI